MTNALVRSEDGLNASRRRSSACERKGVTWIVVRSLDRREGNRVVDQWVIDG